MFDYAIVQESPFSWRVEKLEILSRRSFDVVAVYYVYEKEVGRTRYLECDAEYCLAARYGRARDCKHVTMVVHKREERNTDASRDT